MHLADILAKRAKTLAGSAPEIFNLARPGDRQKLSRLLASRAVHHVRDDFEEQMREYFQVSHPALVYIPDFEEKFQEHLSLMAKKMPLWQRGRWVYFPWLSTVSHILEDKEFQMVRTARNRNLITQKEQGQFYNAIIGIAGLSIGNSVALTIALQGGGRYIRLADNDRLALSNTNRIRSGVDSLGIPKIEMTARQIYALNPYAKVDLFPDGITEKNIARFFAGPPRLDLVIDEIDNLAIKHLMRQYAKKHKIAVVMATDNGDHGLVDIERYDTHPDTKFFHGRMGSENYEELKKLNKFAAGKKIANFVGVENVPPRMIASLKEIGKTLVSWPQLGGAALLNGSAVAYCARKILTDGHLVSNRMFISLDGAAGKK